ncbi:Lrp/AsnC family transcriptional regulator [Terricaulis silvestris]|uniref:Leucine-responsive regulatory protein n=1 Tax=Terricaulis silvestris TaxID=2686094 RepID=A0A6I6MJI4_9CAUL|nr:Lrp/AsnC family transcriptional regulator [Terricaulis silvestris]QGZ93288.1 Leucine-responsive regulatory protein [Terricaulis silvestris]
MTASTENSPVQLDDFDHKILIELERNGVLTAAALAERIGLSPSACHRRVKAMEAAGVIEGYAAILSEKALGRSATVFVAVTLENQRSETMASFERAVAKCREVQDCHLMTGESDYLLRITIGEDDGYERVHRETLSRLPGVRRLVSNFTIRTVFRRAASIAH